MPLTSAEIARAVHRDTKKQGADLRNNLPGEIRKWLEGTPWYRTRFPTQELKDKLYWKVRYHMLKRMGGKKKKSRLPHSNGPLPSKDTRQVPFIF